MDARHEEYLRAQAGRGQEMVLEMIRSLSSALVYPEAGNVATNEKLWDVYAAEWKTSSGDEGGSWVQDMASGNRGAAGLGPECLACVGDEWAPHAHTRRVVDEWLAPLLGPTLDVAEVGSGGGRIAKLIAPNVRTLHCFDVSAKMLAKARVALEGSSNVSFSHVHGDPSSDGAAVACFDDVEPRAYRTLHRAAFDIVYCAWTTHGTSDQNATRLGFDVMVHMDLHAMFACLKRIRALVKDDVGSRVFVSTSNLTAPRGWARFEKQAKYTVGGFFFITPETARTLFKRAGFDLVAESTMSPPESLDGESPTANVYYDRDYLAVLKPAPAPEGS